MDVYCNLAGEEKKCPAGGAHVPPYSVAEEMKKTAGQAVSFGNITGRMRGAESHQLTQPHGICLE